MGGDRIGGAGRDIAGPQPCPVAPTIVSPGGASRRASVTTRSVMAGVVFGLISSRCIQVAPDIRPDRYSGGVPA